MAYLKGAVTESSCEIIFGLPWSGECTPATRPENLAESEPITRASMSSK